VKKTILNPASLAKPSGYANGVLTEGGRLLFIAGQTGMDASGQIVAAPPDIVSQFKQALANVQAVVNQADGQMTDIVKLTIYVVGKAHYQSSLKEIGEVYQAFFGKYYPAMALVEVSSLWDEQAMVEIEGIAVLAGSTP
jgi:enamine deaminase RidA (YjgF/YER057c/UK114 family)